MSESGLFGTRKRCGCNGSAGSIPAISISSVIATKGGLQQQTIGFIRCLCNHSGDARSIRAMVVTKLYQAKPTSVWLRYS